MLTLKISDEARNDSLTAEIVSNFTTRLSHFTSRYGPKWDKDSLLLEHFHGRFLKSCPGTGADYFCCGYHVLNNALNCTFGCDYCILQAYLEGPRLVFYTNWEEMKSQLLAKSVTDPDQKFRIGTGELSDSLYLDPITHFSKRIVPFIARQRNMILELKTKSNYINNLIDLNHQGRTVIAWSLAPDDLIERHEPWAPSLGDRLQAAAKVSEWGYPIAFHFDPVINYPDWRRGYGDVVERLIATIDMSNIVWISLGAFRFTKKLAQVMNHDKRKSELLQNEFIYCPDGKYRYFWKIRAEMLHFIASGILNNSPDTCLYLCMESAKLWKESLGWVPSNDDEIGRKLDESIFSRLE